MSRLQEFFALSLTLLALYGGTPALADDKGGGQEQTSPPSPASAPPQSPAKSPKSAAEQLSPEDKQIVKMLDLLQMMEMLNDLDNVAALEDAP